MPGRAPPRRRPPPGMRAAGVESIGEDQQGVIARRRSELQPCGLENGIPKRTTSASRDGTCGGNAAGALRAGSAESRARTGRHLPADFLRRGAIIGPHANVLIDGDHESAVTGAQNLLQDGEGRLPVFRGLIALTLAGVDQDAEGQRLIVHPEILHDALRAVVENAKLLASEAVHRLAVAIQDSAGNGDELRIGTERGSWSARTVLRRAESAASSSWPALAGQAAVTNQAGRFVGRDFTWSPSKRRAKV